MNLGTREQFGAYVPTGTIGKALGNYFGNTTEIMCLTNANGKRQTI